jgi:ABC-type transport system involved in multi-copper enzyme maturation permease subunit
MTVARSRFGLPLLARELTEIASRSRTYWLRVVYAALLFLAAYLQFHDILQSGGGRFAMLGHGRRMFETLLGLQFAGIYLFMPIVGCSAITHEKERNSLSLLLLTRLGPTTIVLEKLLSRLVPMFVFLLLAMPLLALTYTLGGVTEFRLWASIAIMSLTAVQVAALTLMCSAYCATTGSAFVASYALSFVSLFFCSCCGLSLGTGAGAFSVDSIGEFVLRTFLVGGSTVVFLMLARGFLISRAFVVPHSALGHSLKRLDRFYVTTDAATGGIVLVRHTQSLPLDEPVAWRELAKSSTGSLVRLVLAIEVPLLFLLTVGVGMGSNSGMFEYIEILLWVIAVVLVVVAATGAMSRERDRQTMDVLLATPLTGREILTQKLKSVWRVDLLLWIPFGSLALFRTLFWVNEGFAGSTGLRLLTSLVAVVLYLPLLIWISLWMGLRLRSQARAILLMLGVIGGWTLLPTMLLDPYDFSQFSPVEQFGWLLFSPASIFRNPPAGNLFGLLTTAIHACIYGFFLVAIRRYVLSRADALLGRLGDQEQRTTAQLAIRPRPATETSK